MRGLATRRPIDAALTRLLGLSPAGGYTVRQVRIPMRDRVELLADHYAPATPARGTLLVRSPYGRGLVFSMLFARIYAARGYHVIGQSVRGTFGSGGVFTPMVNEVDDGTDTAAWLRDQPWFTGSFATIGASYLGLTQWALLMDPPPELVAAVITAGPHDFSSSSWGTGSFTLNDFLGWSYLMTRQETGGPVRAAVREVTARRTVAAAAADLPLGAAGRALLGGGAPWYESWLAHPDVDEPFWDPYRFSPALDRVRVPVLLHSGWQDLFLAQTLAQYRRLHDRGVPVAMTVGPWSHSQLLTRGLGTVTRETLSWLDTHLAGAGATERASPVRVAVTDGTGHRWCKLASWPPPTEPRPWYLHPGRRLAQTPAPAPGCAAFRYDPAKPTPTIGGPLLAGGAGYRNDSSLARRADVLSFTTDPLTRDTVVFGNPVVDVQHTADIANVDLFIRVSEVDPAGRSRNVADGYRRLRHGGGLVRVELDAVAHRFTAGARIRLLIAGGSHPRYARNLGTDAPALTGERGQPATHTVRFHGSRLLLPVATAATAATALEFTDPPTLP